jgi:hypothetical protein
MESESHTDTRLSRLSHASGSDDRDDSFKLATVELAIAHIVFNRDPHANMPVQTNGYYAWI